MDYGDTQLIFEVRGLETDGFHGSKVGNIAHLEEGTIVDGKKFYPKGETKPVSLTSVMKSEVDRGPGRGHFGNFIAAVRSRKVDDLNADILEGHHSAALCHLANISYRLGQEVPFNKATKAFGDDKEAYETLDRMKEHLKDNKVALDGQNYRLGRKLTFDAATESFIGDSDANQLLTRHYRAPVRGSGPIGLSLNRHCPIPYTGLKMTPEACDRSNSLLRHRSGTMIGRCHPLT